jgi:GTP-binding protein
MRREGYEFFVSRPEVIFKEGENGRLEPIEHIYVEVHNDYFGPVSEMMGRRRGILQDIRYGDDGTVYAEYLVPTRGMLGFRQPFLTATRGTGIFHTLFHGYEPYKGEIDTQENGSLVAMESGDVAAYALQHLTQRGTFFIMPGEPVYAGQVVGQHIRDDEELVINVCKTKTLTKVRSGPTAIVEALSTPRFMSLDDSIQYLGPDELLEVTPQSLRIRKKELRHDVRQKMIKRAKRQD